jgi:catechol-2,3-dioxygenase
MRYKALDDDGGASRGWSPRSKHPSSEFFSVAVAVEDTQTATDYYIMLIGFELFKQTLTTTLAAVGGNGSSW